jgi:uncharacterized protein (DUF983 family)
MNTDAKDKVATVVVGIAGTVLLAIVTGIFVGVTWKVAQWIAN